MPSDRSSIQALENILSEVDLLISTTTPLPENRTARCRELLRAALALADDMLNERRSNPAAILGSKGGSATAARHDSDFFRQLAARRKKRAGGRPRKESSK